MTSLYKEEEFYLYMDVHGPNSDGSKRNYISWLRYVVQLYDFELAEVTQERIEQVVTELKNTQHTRTRYTSDSAVSDIGSALNKYLRFIEQGHISPIVSDIITIANNTSAHSEIETRLGQGKYRQSLIDIWKCCAVTRFSHLDLLVVSHIKPWQHATNTERTDPNNGLLLSPTLDRLFDKGYISFTDDGVIIISPRLTEVDLKQLNIYKEMHLYKTQLGVLPYLKYHRTMIFLSNG